MKQTKLTFALPDPQFEEYYYIGKRSVTIRRNDGITFMAIGGLNFLDKPMGVLFRCSNHPNFNNGYKIETLDQLSKEQLKEFALHVVRTYELRVSEWDSKKRKALFNFIIDGYKFVD